ncbi:MAG: hypothetical protein JW829_12480 [Pirellulales bacterium]|nr:hypothetical protein [Pirellulales bacterium]
METRSLIFSEHDQRTNSVPEKSTLAIVGADTVPVRGAPPRNGTPTSDSQKRRSQHAINELAARIRQRIQAQTCGRVRNLVVTVNGSHVILQGRCSTFYSKQLAQHAAMGVLEDEVLVNDIVVLVAR